MYPYERNPHQSWWKSRVIWVYLAFAAIALLYLVTQHTAHLLLALPYLLLLLCPLMMLFMMRGGHGGHGGQQDAPHHHWDARTRDTDAETWGGKR